MQRLLCILLLLATLPAYAQTGTSRPNIVWVFSEDQSDDYGPYGEQLAKTPNIDRMASEGAKFTQAFVTARFAPPQGQR